MGVRASPPRISAPPIRPRTNRSAPVKARLPLPAPAFAAAAPAPAPAPPPAPPPPLPPALPPWPPPLPPAPLVPLLPVVGVPGGPPPPPGATAWLSAAPPVTFSSDESPLINTNNATASRTPYGESVWPLFTSLALQTCANSGARSSNTVLSLAGSLPSAQPAAKSGRPL